MKRLWMTSSLLVLLAWTLAAHAEPPARAVAVLHPTKNNKVHGVVWFTRVKDRVRVVADISGLTPGIHGFHVHEYGDCSSDDASSAGGHFNPTKMPHAAQTAGMRHEGDLGNVTADASGNAHVDILDSKLKLDGPNSIVGRAVIVHANPDDLKTQPAGNAGPRVACGVIGIAAPGAPQK